MNTNPFFSIIMPHFHKCTPHNRFIRAIESIRSQSFRDWELLIYHDGPIDDENVLNYREDIIKDSRIKFTITSRNHADWGHSLRDIGIRAAQGVYIINTNSDNLFYNNAFAIFFAYSRWKKEKLEYYNEAKGERFSFLINPDCLVYGIKLMGVLTHSNARKIIRIPNSENFFQTVLPGWPPNKYSVDAMQLIATREIWGNTGFWYKKNEESDGDLIQEITSKYGYLVIPEILGEHW